MRTPASCGLPFPSWRKGQDRAARELLFSDRRFNMLTTPTGGGKTGAYMAVAGTDDGRHAVLTGTKLLMDQIGDLYRSMGIVDMRGRSNYICDIDHKKTAAEAVCTGGVFCRLMKEGGCAYYDQKREAAQARLVVTNYSYWLHDEESGALGDFDTLILDEAHNAPDQISEFAAVTVSRGELISFQLDAPPTGMRRPSSWASKALYQVEAMGKESRDVERRRTAFALQRRLARLCRLSDSEWVGSKPDDKHWRWDLVDPGSLAEDLLFRGASKVIFVSASVRRKTLQLLGVKEDVRVIEQDSTFPVIRRPIYYRPVTSVGRAMSRWDREDLYDAIDAFIEPRLDRKGLLHSHSFEWAKEIYDHADHKTRQHFLVHEQGQPGEEVLARFRIRSAESGTLLLSPSMTTGVDLPYDECEYQVIPKCPFPPLGSPLIRARMARDKDYYPYVTMQTLVQMTGRGMRAQDDQCETIILDSNFGRLRGQHWDFAPKYFHVAVQTLKGEAKVPKPPPPLRAQTLAGWAVR